MSEKKIIRYKDRYLGVKEVGGSSYDDRYIDKCGKCYCRGDGNMCRQLAKDFNIRTGLCPAYCLFYNSFSFIPNSKQCIFTEMINSIFTCYE